MATIFNDDFRDFIQALNDHKVDYILVGGYAVILHGYRRVSGDHAFAQSMQYDENGLIIRFIHLNNLIEAKKAAGRFKDLDDIEKLSQGSDL